MRGVRLMSLSDEICGRGFVWGGRVDLLHGDTGYPLFRYYNITSRICVVGRQINQ